MPSGEYLVCPEPGEQKKDCISHIHLRGFKTTVQTKGGSWQQVAAAIGGRSPSLSKASLVTGTPFSPRPGMPTGREVSSFNKPIPLPICSSLCNTSLGGRLICKAKGCSTLPILATSPRWMLSKHGAGWNTWQVRSSLSAAHHWACRSSNIQEFCGVLGSHKSWAQPAKYRGDAMLWRQNWKIFEG
jgi:hypothetical protein